MSIAFASFLQRFKRSALILRVIVLSFRANWNNSLNCFHFAGSSKTKDISRSNGSWFSLFLFLAGAFCFFISVWRHHCNETHADGVDGATRGAGATASSSFDPFSRRIGTPLQTQKENRSKATGNQGHRPRIRNYWSQYTGAKEEKHSLGKGQTKAATSFRRWFQPAALRLEFRQL